MWQFLHWTAASPTDPIKNLCLKKNVSLQKMKPRISNVQISSTRNLQVFGFQERNRFFHRKKHWGESSPGLLRRHPTAYVAMINHWWFIHVYGTHKICKKLGMVYYCIVSPISTFLCTLTPQCLWLCIQDRYPEPHTRSTQAVPCLGGWKTTWNKDTRLLADVHRGSKHPTHLDT